MNIHILRKLMGVKGFLLLALIFFSMASYADKNPFELYGLLQCSRSGFYCIPVKKGETWIGLFPNERQREIVMRLNRTNVALFYRNWIVIPKDLKHINYMDLAPFPNHLNGITHKLLLIDLAKFAFAAYGKNGNLIYWGPASGGKDWCDDTHHSCKSAAGHFTITRMRGVSCESSTYPLDTNGGAPMPWCMYYYKGFAIHGSTLSGFIDRSRGCIRLFNRDAQWLNQHFVKIGTDVIVERQ